MLFVVATHLTAIFGYLPNFSSSTAHDAASETSSIFRENFQNKLSLMVYPYLVIAMLFALLKLDVKKLACLPVQIVGGYCCLIRIASGEQNFQVVEMAPELPHVKFAGTPSRFVRNTLHLAT